MRTVRTVLPALAILAMLAVPAPSATQAWPTRPVTLVVPFGAGGSTDGVARLIAKHLSDKLGAQFVVENRAGAAGNIAAAAVVKAQPDGNTLLLATTGPAVVNRLTYRSLSFDPRKDFSPVVLIGTVPQAIVVGKRLPVKSFKELIDRARANPGALTFGNSGIGTMAHISAVSLARATGIQVTHITYRGGAQALTDLLGGQIDAAFPAYIPQIATMNTLAITANERMEQLPNVPTVRETGIADVVAGTWFGIVAPAGTPSDIIDKINRIVNDFVGTAAARDLFGKLGVRALGGTPAAMRTFMAEEEARWEPIVKWANIRIN